jgi:hypothetical protein
MPHSITSKTQPALGAILLLVLASLVLAACGSSSSGSSSSKSSSASASATTPTTTAPGPRPGGARFTAVRECMRKNGITLPKRTPGQRPSGGFLPGAGGGPQLPKGVTRAQYEAAIKKCGGFGGAGRFNGGQRFASPSFKAALAKFATCLRENGVKIPAPNTSGKGPIFDTKGINTASAQFKAAETKCSSVLHGAFGSPGGRGPSGAGAAG